MHSTLQRRDAQLWCFLPWSSTFSPCARRSRSFPSFQQHCFFEHQLCLHRLTQGANLPGTCCSGASAILTAPWREPTPQHRLHKHHPYLQLISLGLWCSFFPRLLLRFPFATIPTETTQGFAAHGSLNPHKSLQGKRFHHFLQFTTTWLSQPAGSKGNAPSQAPSTPPQHPALRSTSPSAQFVHSTTKRCREMALCLTLNSEPQQKRCPLVLLQCMRCMMLSILCIRPNIFTLESKFLGRADITEDSLCLCFCTPSVPRYDRDPGRAVSVRALLGSVNELPEVVLYNTGMHSSY